MTRSKFISLVLGGAAFAGVATMVTVMPSGSPSVAASPIALHTGADAAHPTVVELFESQGCSDCPPANANVNALAARPDILALNFAVTYWDQLGWKDTFARPAYTARQWDYAHAAGRGQVATPQVIINGGGTVVGADAPSLARAITEYARGTSGPRIVAANGRVMIGPGVGHATVWLVRYDARTLAVPIRAGENGGRTLDHRNIVRDLHALGEWTGAGASFVVPVPADRTYRSAVLVQQGKGGRIIAAARI